LRKQQGFCFSEALTARWHKLNEKQNPWQCKALQGLFLFQVTPWKPNDKPEPYLLINLLAVIFSSIISFFKIKR
jgi:hypothetical protein